MKIKNLTVAGFLIRLASFLLVCTGLIWIYMRLASLGLDYEWQWNRAWRQLYRFTSTGFKPGPLLEGILMTLGITALSTILSVITGFIMAMLRLSPWPCCALLARAYVSIWRNTPLLLQLFFIYFLVSPLLDINAFWSAVLALSAFEGAYLTELFRAALLSVPRAQWEAALSLGFNLRQTLFLVILPQSLRNAAPAFINQLISILKDTSLVSAIAVADLTMRAQAVVAETFLAFEVWLLVALIYLLLSLFIVLPALWLKKTGQWDSIS